jgi:hypothetical protein
VQAGGSKHEGEDDELGQKGAPVPGMGQGREGDVATPGQQRAGGHLDRQEHGEGEHAEPPADLAHHLGPVAGGQAGAHHRQQHRGEGELSADPHHRRQHVGESHH